MARFQWAAAILCGILLPGHPAAQADEPLYCIKEHGKCGFINAAGRVVIPPTYDDNYLPFSEGLAPVEMGAKWGYIDRAGKMVIQPQFGSVNVFRNGLASVCVGQPFEGEGKWGYIDHSGHFVLGPDELFSSSDGFRDGLMQIKVGAKWGYIDQKGKQVIAPQYRYAGSFSEGRAAVSGDGWEGCIDTSGVVVFRLAHATQSYGSFHEGLAFAPGEHTSKFGYVDKLGHYVISPKFDEADDFSDGRARVCIVTQDDAGWPIRKWGFIDKTGAVAIPIQYEAASTFSEGLAQVTASGKTGFVDRDGKLVIPCQFDSAEAFHDGLASVNVGGWGDTGWSGYIDKTGRFIWRPSDYQKIDQARHDQENRMPTIRLFTNGKAAEKGLLVSCAKQVQLAGPHAGEVSITVANLLDEEVFLEVTGFDSLGGEFEAKDGGVYMGGGSFTFFPDNTNLLKRMHAVFYRNGKPLVCGCCIARIHSKVPPEALALGRARGHVNLYLTGYYRNSGKAFSESIELPVEIGQWDEGGELLKPAGKGPTTGRAATP